MKNKWLEDLQNEFHQKTVGAFQEKMNEMYEAIGVESPNQKDNEGIDNNSPKKYENIIFGSVSTIKAVKGIKPNTENTPIDDKEFKNTNWDAFLMKSIDDALDSLKKIAISAFKDENKKFVKTLFLQTHGAPTSIGIVGNNICAGSPRNENEKPLLNEDGLDDSEQVDIFYFEDYLMFLESNKTIDEYIKDKNWSDLEESKKSINYLNNIDKLVQISKYIVDGGTLILGGCNIGEIDKDIPENMLVFFAKNILKYRINCIANQDFTRGAGLRYIKDSNPKKFTKYVFLDRNITGNQDYSKGWRIITTNQKDDMQKKNLKLLSKGEPYIFVFE